jgi:hypothetical protein
MLLAPSRVCTRKRYTVRVRRSRAIPVLLLATCLLAAIAVGPASAQQAPNDPPAPNSGVHLESWALAPTGTDPSQPSSRPNLTYTVDPGSTVTDSVSLWNYSDVAMNFHVYATDAYNNRSGEFTLLPGSAKPKDAGNWIVLQTSYLTVPARTRVDIPISITVPAGATPGDHAAGVVAASNTSTGDQGSANAVIERRTGSRVYVRVKGNVNPKLVVENLTTDYSGSFNPLDGKLGVDYTVRNTGNVRLSAKQQLEVKDVLGRTVASRNGKLLEDILPGATVTLHEEFTGVPAALRLTTSVKLIPTASAGSTEAPPASETYSSSAWAIPWTVLLFALLAFLLWRIYRRYRARAQGAPPAGPAGAGGGGGAGTDPAGAARQPEPAMRFDARPGGAPA